MAQISILPFDGVGNFAACKTVVDFFLGLGPDRKAVIYRDGDGLTTEEKLWLKGKAANNLSANTRYLIGSLTDVEHYFCRASHVAECYDITEVEASIIIDKVIQDNQAWLSGKLTNKRQDIKNKEFKNCDKWASTDELTVNGISFDFSYGKALVGKILHKLESSGYAPRDIYRPSIYLKHEDFEGIFEF